MYNTFVYKLANSNDGDVLITAGDVTVPVKLTQVDVSHSTDGSQVDIACSVMFEKRGRTYDVASMHSRPKVDYTKFDVGLTKAVCDWSNSNSKKSGRYPWGLEIENVIFNDPATIVFWKDGTKTVVKCQEGDTFDPEKGLAMAMCKKMLGNKGNFNEVFKKWMPEINVKTGMTCRERLALEYPDEMGHAWAGGCCGCPHIHGYADRLENCRFGADKEQCRECWDRKATDIK